MSKIYIEHVDVVQCPRCRSLRIEEHDDPGDIPYYECLDCGIQWDGSETAGQPASFTDAF